MKHSIATSKNGIPIYVDLIRSRAAEHIARSPQLLGLIKELMQRTSVTKPVIRIQHDMGRNIGYSYIVETSDKDAVLYARRIREKFYTRFVKNSKPEQSQFLSVHLHRTDDGSYELDDAWVGKLIPSIPGSEDEVADSKDYWLNHAFVLESEAVLTNSITKVSPY